jgi:hypothetical protein
MTVGSMELPPEGMVLGGVALAGDPERGTPTTEGLTLLFTVEGITVQGPQPGMERLLAWSGLDAAACRDQTQLEGGRIATVLSLTSGHQTVHFLLPAETVSPGQAAYLDQALPAWLARYGGPTGAREPTPAAGAAAGAAAPPAVRLTPPPPPPAPVGSAVGSSSPATPARTEGAVPEPSAPSLAGGEEPEPAIDPRTGAATWPDPLSGQDLTVAAPKKRFWTLRPSRPAGPAGAPAANGTAIGAPLAGEAAGATQPDAFGRVPGEEKGAKRPAARRQTLVLLVVLLLVVVGAGAYLLSRRSSTSTPATTAAPAVTPAPSSNADLSLAQSVNLRLADLPAGWEVAPASAVVAPTAAEGRARTAALPALASCLGVSAPVVDQLFGGEAPPTVSATAASQTFAQTSDPAIQMRSTTAVMRTAAEAQATLAPFAAANFISCFTQFEMSVFSVLAPGTTVSVSQVTLTAPTGVTVYGYLSTVAVPGQGDRVVGNGYLVGGRVVATIDPLTNGPPVPSSAFDPAFGAMTERIAADLHR